MNKTAKSVNKSANSWINPRSSYKPISTYGKNTAIHHHPKWPQEQFSVSSLLPPSLSAFMALIARSALYVRRQVKTTCAVRPSVRSPFSVLCSENNHFLRVAYEGWTHLWGQWGFENPILKKLKKNGQSVLSLANLSDLDPLLDTSFELWKKHVPDVDHVTWWKNLSVFAPLSCTVYLVIIPG